MRRPERIPIFLKLVDFDKLQERWDVDISQSFRGIILKKETKEYWINNPDLRFGQMLINLEYMPDKLNIWNDEEPYILESQGIHPREYTFWGRNYDKDMNQLPKTEWTLIKDMSTDHIQAIIDGGWSRGLMQDLFLNELELRKQLPARI